LHASVIGFDSLENTLDGPIPELWVRPFIAGVDSGEGPHEVQAQITIPFQHLDGSEVQDKAVVVIVVRPIEFLVILDERGIGHDLNMIAVDVLRARIDRDYGKHGDASCFNLPGDVYAGCIEIGRARRVNLVEQALIATNGEQYQDGHKRQCNVVHSYHSLSSSPNGSLVVHLA
jgi:hypothetical protein